jgi:Ca2+-transporting ATPase
MHDHEAHSKPIDGLLAALGSDARRGLSQSEALRRGEAYGRNELREKPRPGFVALLWRQFNNYLVIILIVAALVSAALGEYVDAIAILVIVVLNAVVGVIQEAKAEEALAALQKLSAPNAQVMRDGRQTLVPSRELVAGDVVLLEAGNYVPADLRLLESVNLKVDEASLTGESQAVEKDARVVLDRAIPLGDRRNVAFMGTLITYGRGCGLVTAIGMQTQIGLIAEMIQSADAEDTPLQKKLAHLGRVLGSACLGICALVFVYGLVRDTQPGMIADVGVVDWLLAERKDIVVLFMTAVSLAIAAVPEGLPAIVTICLALGMRRMIRHHALIRKLPAVETLGCATVVCTDKTGTLTQNEMTVVRAWTGGKSLQLSGEGYCPQGRFTRGGTPFAVRDDADARLLLQGALLCNDARLEQCANDRADEHAGQGGRPVWQITGDPTEGALVVAAAKAGYTRDEANAACPRVQEIPFDSERKRMSTLHRLDGEAARACLAAFAATPFFVFVKGAPDVIVELCRAQVEDGRLVPLDEPRRAAVLEQNRDMARRALRVLAVACRPLDALPDQPSAAEIESGLVFVGLLGMIDPPRPEIVDALRRAREAGLRSVMVTGDYRETAEAIALDIGLLTPDAQVLSGAEIEQLSAPELAERSDRLAVCCRVSPQHKTRIVDAFKSCGHVVAMTGDGVNDAPALKRAHIGIAMGITGSDVAKQSADMILTDDNFASIIAAIEQGRIIYANIRKFVYFLLACNIGELLIVFGAMLAALPIPLMPVQLLWLNLVTDGAPALALGLETGDADIMRQPPRAPGEAVINRAMAIGIAVVGVVDALAVLGVFVLALARYPGQLAHAQTIAFVTLCTSELLRAFTARSEYHSVLSIGVFSNRAMVWAVGVSLLLMLLVVYTPWLRPFFDTLALTPADWLMLLPFCFASPLAMELLKYVRRRRAWAVVR